MPKLINTWDELKECTSETHTLEIGDGKGWIHPKNDMDHNSFEGRHYLSTHTFYGGMNEGYTELLQACGFDVVLANWDEDAENKAIIVVGGGKPRLATGTPPTYKCKVDTLPIGNSKYIWNVPNKYCDYLGRKDNGRILLRFHDNYGTTILINDEYLNQYFEKQ